MDNSKIYDLENDCIVEYAFGQYSSYDMEEILSEVSLKQNYINIYGKTIPLPRLTAWYGDDGANYRYSGIWNDPKPWTKILLELRENLSRFCDTRFNSCLVNFYRDGNDGVSAHSDDEPEICETIASVSFGAERIFRMRSKTDKRKFDLTLGHGDLMIMRGSTQQYWTHEIVKTKKKIGKRLNLTFRQVRKSDD